MCLCFFFKQKTAYEMRISDWSSDVCSSDLSSGRRRVETRPAGLRAPASCCHPERSEGSGLAAPEGRSLAALGTTGTMRPLRRPLAHSPQFLQELLEQPPVRGGQAIPVQQVRAPQPRAAQRLLAARSEEHTSELQSLMRTS